jgi:hypothetical protein
MRKSSIPLWQFCKDPMCLTMVVQKQSFLNVWGTTTVHKQGTLEVHFMLQRYIHIDLDLVSQIRDVVLVRRTFSSGKPQGVGILEWGGDGNGEISLRATWNQGGQDPITARRDSK